jgi:uncharacterized membrane protein YhaH (DUF805 family)
MDAKWLFFGSSGRLARKPFWFASIILLLLSPWVWQGLASAFGAPALTGGLRIASSLADLLLIWPNVMLIIKRQHDRGQYPWLAWTLAPAVAAFSVAELALGTSDVFDAIPEPYGTIIAVPFLILILVAVVELGFRRGTRGDNAYGPDPLGAAKPS